MHVQNLFITAKQVYNVDNQIAQLEIQFSQFNIEQYNVFDTIVQNMNNNLKQAHYFVQGPADINKIFL